jgi:hypothetical protein
MLRILHIGLSAAFWFAAFAISANAEQTTSQLMDSRLRAGELKELHAELTAQLGASPTDDQIRFALGGTEFLMAIEHISQSMYRYGLELPRGLEHQVPFFRFPLPHNPRAEHLTYEKMRDVFKQTVADLAIAEATLASIGKNEVELQVAIGIARLDLNGDGTAAEDETLWRVFNATLAGGNLPAQDAERFVITFDRGDVAWLRAYTHVLSALAEFTLAYDWHASFDASFQMFFPNAGLPNAILNDYRSDSFDSFDAGPIADAIAFVHLAHWHLQEPERMRKVLSHLESVVSLSRESWTFVLAEADDKAEWIPNPLQKSGVLGIEVTQQRIDGWMSFLDEFDLLLKGRKLIPHWRLAKGINLRRVFTEPTTFDPILWVQGSAALPYSEFGPLTTADTWNRIMNLFEGNFFGYAIWFN